MSHYSLLIAHGLGRRSALVHLKHEAAARCWGGVGQGLVVMLKGGDFTFIKGCRVQPTFASEIISIYTRLLVSGVGERDALQPQQSVHNIMLCAQVRSHVSCAQLCKLCGRVGDEVCTPERRHVLRVLKMPHPRVRPRTPGGG